MPWTRLAGAISGGVERRGEVFAIARKRIRAVLPHAVVQRQDAGEQRAMRRQSQRDRRVGVRESNRLSRELLERRRLRADAVGAEGVEGDEEEVGVFGLAVFCAGKEEERDEKRMKDEG